MGKTGWVALQARWGRDNQKPMKGLNIGGLLLGVAIAGAGVALAVTNPGQAAYNEFATEQLTAYLDENVCSRASDVNLFGDVLREQCGVLLQDNQTQLTALIESNTERQNYIIFSIYRTDLSADLLLPPILSQSVPSYHFETIGVFQRFQVYKAERMQ